MRLLDRIEQTIEHAMEGSISTIFRRSIQPAEIGRKLERAMMAHLAASVGNPIAPNDFRVRLHPEDLLQVADYAVSLSRHFERWLADTAQGRGLTMMDRVRVQLVADDTIGRRDIRVVALITDRPVEKREQQDVVQRTEIYRVIRETAGVAAIRLQVVAGSDRSQEFFVRDPVTTIGRALDNTIVLECTDVSRHHARLETTDQGARIVDLGSTNGTCINGERIESGPIRSGDEITVGTVRLQVLPPDPGAGPW